MPAYETHTIGSRNPLKRWLHRQRFRASLRFLRCASAECFLDYGCGDGELALQVHVHHPSVKIVAFDPAHALYEQAVEKLRGFPDITVTQHFDTHLGTFDRVACLETIEHLPESELQAVFANIHAVLKQNGFCLFTFPIEHGLISLCKNAYRLITKRDKYVSLSRTVRCFFGVLVPREQQECLSDCNYIYSHIGFDCREMIQKIRQHFSIEEVHVLPMGCISFGLGNSVAVVARKT